MKRSLSFIFCLGLLIFWSSCRQDFEFTESSGQLEFSKDTVYLDTVFSNIGSSTYNLKVYNNTDQNILIPSLRLALGETSEYRLNVDGIAGKEFQNVEILAQDSMFVFIETTIDINNLPNLANEFLYTDKIEFGTGVNTQDVDLVTLVKDAIFIYPDKDLTTGIVETLTLTVGGELLETEIQGRYLEPTELTFTNEKPYVIYGYAAVPENETLTINAGARVHFHANSGLIVTNNASLNVNGEWSTDQELLENEIIFEGDRLEPIFEDVPGQWGTIWLFENSTSNIIKYATIKNATVGVWADGNQDAVQDKLTITNSQIYNSSNFGLLGRASSISGENLVINNSGQSSFAGTIGGKYNFTHCTFANYWNNSFRQFPTVLLNNYTLDENNTPITNNLEEANFNNCIIYGNDNIELFLDEESGSDFNYMFTDVLIRYQTTNNPIDFNEATHFSNITLNADPDFKEPFENMLIIGDDSAANGIGNTTTANQVPSDILGEDRTLSPDLGAYQHTTFE